MKGIVETGTDVATVCFFDVAALPENFELRMKNEAVEVTEELAREGRMWCINTGSDGAFLFHFYVDEDVPPLIRKHSHEPQSVGRFVVPSGTICACGAEYAARDPWSSGGAGSSGGLRKYSHMGGKCDVAPGEYSVTVWRSEWPEGMIEKEIKKRGGGEHNVIGTTTSILFLATLIGTLIMFFKTLKRWRLDELDRTYLWIWCVLVLAWIVTVLLMRKLLRLERDPTRKAVEGEFPSIVVQMKRMITK